MLIKNFHPRVVKSSVFTNIIILLSTAGICLLLMFSVSRDQLNSIYNYALFVADVTLVLYLNVHNSVDFYNGISDYFQQGIQLKTGHIFPLLPIIVGAWIFYIISLTLYSKTFHTIKPVVFTLAAIPVLTRYVIGSQGEPSLWLCCCFFVTVQLFLEGIFHCVYHIYFSIVNTIVASKWMYRMYGLTVLLLFHWKRLEIPLCLASLSIISYTTNLVTIVVFSTKELSVIELFHLCMAHTCSSILSVLGCCFIIYKLSSLLLQFVGFCYREELVAIPDDPAGNPNGMREGFGFFFLSLYTGLSSCDISRKMVLLELISYLILSALMRSMFEMTEPLLLTLGSQHSRSYKKHLRVLVFSITLLLVSVYLAFSVYSLKERIPFVTPNVITIAQITAALILYSMYMYEAHQDNLWENLDDYVYYINGSCRLFEFVVISAVLCYRVCDFSLEWTLFQIVMAILHVYVNIWTPAKEGWNSLRMRHMVNQRMSALPYASQEEIEDLQDVCAICLDELRAAKVTPCRHYFHTICLRKWLNVQNKCPMCHTTIVQ